VVGASATSFTPANDFIRQCLALGFAGRMVPIHPKADTVEGLPAARSLAEVDGPIDYVYVAVGAAQVPDLIAGARGKVRYAQVISSGFGEIAGGVALERRLAAAARDAGVRLLGPNCLGLYSPRGGLAFVGDCPREAGGIGIVSQSGGLAVDMILRGKTRGLRFSGLVTLGNSIDLGPADLIEYYLADPNTRAVGVYIEDVKDGRRFFEVLRAANARKPVVVLLGGQTAQGRQAAASHTGSLASPAALWAGLARQTGAVVTDTLEQYLDTLLAFQSLAPRRDHATSRCVLFGNGGGTSVLAADAFARRGLVIVADGRRPRSPRSTRSGCRPARRSSIRSTRPRSR
jgi:acyl-CoA synthetase (NDP forming)